MIKEGAVRLVESYDSAKVDTMNELAGKLHGMAEEAFHVIVDDEDSFITAVGMIDALESAVGIIEMIIEPFRERAYDYYKGVVAEKKSILERPTSAVAHLRSEVGRYKEKVDEAILEAERRAVEEGSEGALVHSGSIVDDVGISYREYWKAECTDIVALCGAIAEGRAPVDLVSFNGPAGNKLARSLRDLLDNIPGLRSYKETRMVRR